jgi:hypothetical protein
MKNITDPSQDILDVTIAGKTIGEIVKEEKEHIAEVVVDGVTETLESLKEPLLKHTTEAKADIIEEVKTVVESTIDKIEKETKENKETKETIKEIATKLEEIEVTIK